MPVSPHNHDDMVLHVWNFQTHVHDMSLTTGHHHELKGTVCPCYMKGLLEVPTSQVWIRFWVQCSLVWLYHIPVLKTFPNKYPMHYWSSIYQMARQYSSAQHMAPQCCSWGPSPQSTPHSSSMWLQSWSDILQTAIKCNTWIYHTRQQSDNQQGEIKQSYFSPGRNAPKDSNRVSSIGASHVNDHTTHSQYGIRQFSGHWLGCFRLWRLASCGRRRCCCCCCCCFRRVHRHCCCCCCCCCCCLQEENIESRQPWKWGLSLGGSIWARQRSRMSASGAAEQKRG